MSKVVLPFNQLSPAQVERLSLLAEECAEVIQIVGKILRHGYENYSPRDPGKRTNRFLLESELGHVEFAVELMKDWNDVSAGQISNGFMDKSFNVWQYLHYHKSEAEAGDHDAAE